MNMPATLAMGTHNTQEGFTRRMKKYHDDNNDEKGPLVFFDAHNLLPIPLKATEQIPVLLKEIIREVGEPHCYGPTAEEIEAEKRERERKEAEIRIKAEEEQRIKEEMERIAVERRQVQWSKRLQELRIQERLQLEVQSEPFRKYLISSVMPALTKAMVEIAEVRPEDPIDYLAEYLFQYAESHEGDNFKMNVGKNEEK
jgi:adenylate kinase